MKLFATILSIMLSTVTFSQSDNFVQYQIDATAHVTAIDVTAHVDHANENKSVGRIVGIHNSTINLELSVNTDYTVVINNVIVLEIKSEDIAEYVVQQNSNNRSAVD